MRTLLLLIVTLLAWALPAMAQTVRGDRFVFNTGPCTMRSGSGSPEGVVTGKVCDRWHRTDSPFYVYTKTSGTGNTGWTVWASTDLSDSVNLARLNAANSFSLINPITTIAESWIGPSPTAGIYFKGGNVGIGTATPGSKLTVSGNSSISADVARMRLDDSSGNAASRNWWLGNATLTPDYGTLAFVHSPSSGTAPSLVSMVIKSDGNVGIGTTAPLSKLAINGGLHVGGDSDAGDNNAIIDGTLAVTGASTLTGLLNANGGIRVSADASNYLDLTVGADGSTALSPVGTAPALVLSSTDSITLTTPSAITIGSTDAGTTTVMDKIDLIHRSSGTPAAGFGTGLLFSGESTFTDRNMARVQSIWTTATDASRASALQFQTLTAAGALTTQVTINGSGNVGIGATPSRRLHVGGTTLTQFIAAQSTPPTCSTNCGTTPSITGSDTFMTVTMGTGSPASGFVITFSGAWPAAPSCVAAMATAGMAVGKLPLTVVTTTTTATVVTNGTAPGASEKYHVHCGGPS